MPIFGRFPPLPWWHPNDPDCIRPKYSILRLGPRIELRDSKSGFVHARCGIRNHAHSDSLVIAVDGACPRNGTGATTSSIGVYFGPGNENNLSAKIPDELAGFSGHTNNRAEIYAAIAGLKIARTLCEKRGQRAEKRSVKAALERKWIVRPNGNPDRLNHIVIKSDSAYVVSAVGAGDMGEDAHLKKWILNNFQTAKKETVKNMMLWSELGHEIIHLYQMGVTVQFWHVPRHMNRDADKLANDALRKRLWLRPEWVIGKYRDFPDKELQKQSASVAASSLFVKWQLLDWTLEIPKMIKLLVWNETVDFFREAFEAQDSDEVSTHLRPIILYN
ncbi:hypothetical protein N0V92_011333 [Colletotrichum tropicale]|nr:hypothetical protein N0V92_011333 [Colletotrichum tropicale]